MLEIYNYLTTPWMYLLGSLIVIIVCIFDVIIEKWKLNKTKVTIGDIIIYIMLAAMSWVGLIVTCIVCFVTTTPFCNKTIIKF
jgi:hypothetical protein